jgi:hypothetical protein
MREYIRAAAEAVRENRDLRGPVLGALAYGGIKLAGRVTSNIVGDSSIADFVDYATDVTAPAVGVGYMLSKVGPRTDNGWHIARDAVLCLGSAALAALVGHSVGSYDGSVETLASIAEVTNSITEDHTTAASAIAGGLALPAKWAYQSWRGNSPELPGPTPRP